MSGQLPLRHWAAVIAAVATLIGKADAVIEPRVVSTTYPTDDIVIASLIVPPQAPEADAAPAVQAGIDELAAAGGGVLFLPAGTYRLDTPLVVREGVTVRGDRQPPAAGTLLAVFGGRGDADGPPAITLERGTGLREVTIWYPEQRADDIVPYPWTIKTSEQTGGDNYTIQNVTLVNPYQAIKVGPEWNELHTVRNVIGTPLRTGVFIDTCTDIGRLIDVRFEPEVWEVCGLPGAPDAPSAPLRTHLRGEATGIDMGRSDWEFVHQVTVRGYAVGMVVRAGRQGTTNAVMYGSELTDCGTALRLEQLNAIGLSCTGCELAGDLAVDAPGSYNSTVQFNSCALRGRPAVRLAGPGTLTFQNCRFDPIDAGELAVDAAQGNLSLQDCDVAGKGAAVRLGAGVRHARLLGNRRGDEPLTAAAVANESPGDIAIAAQPLGPARVQAARYAAPPDRRPASTALTVVTAHGASSDSPDNTAAFQAALDSLAGTGGTVYVPAGSWRFEGTLTVPSGVELRGCFDVPHHTVSGGSVLLPLGGREQEDGPPFLSLQPGSGLRGLTVYYPEQNVAEPVPYPWTVRSLGPKCWLIDVTIGNGWQGVDFWSHPSDGHLIRYLAGAFLRRGLFVSKCDGPGWVEDLQFNPHYSLRVHRSLSLPINEGDVGGKVIAWQRAHLDGIVFGRCADESIKGTFLYAAYDGLAFRDDGGGANARVIQHGSDTVSRSCVFESVGERGVDLIHAQLVPLSAQAVGAIVTTPSFRGRAAFYNSQMWAGETSAVLEGPGEVLIQQLNTLTGPIHVRGGRATVENVCFARELAEHVTVGPEVEEAVVRGGLAPGVFRLAAAHGARLTGYGNTAGVPFPDGATELATGWEDGEPQGLGDTVAVRGAGRRAVSEGRCAPTDQDAHQGRRCLMLTGVADDPNYSFAYYRVLEGPVAVLEDTVVTYWVKPLDERGRCAGIDILFSDGSTLRDSGMKTRQGTGVHPGGTQDGPVGEWRELTIDLGSRHAGKIIEAVLFAYDSRSGGGRFTTLFDDVRISSPTAGRPWRATATPPGGPLPLGGAVMLSSPGGAPIRYTLDGTTPSVDSPRYESPLRLDRPGLVEVRFAVEGPDGEVSRIIHAALYEVGAR